MLNEKDINNLLNNIKFNNINDFKKSNLNTKSSNESVIIDNLSNQKQLNLNDSYIKDLVKKLKIINLRFDNGKIFFKSSDFIRSVFVSEFAILLTLYVGLILFLYYFFKINITDNILLYVIIPIFLINYFIILKNVNAYMVLDYNNKLLYVEYKILIFNFKKYIVNFSNVLEIGLSVYQYYHISPIRKSIINFFNFLVKNLNIEYTEKCAYSSVLILCKNNESKVELFNFTGYTQGLKNLERYYNLAKNFSNIINKPFIDNKEYPLTVARHINYEHFICNNNEEIKTYYMKMPVLNINYAEFYDQSDLKNSYWGNFILNGITFNRYSRTYTYNLDILLVGYSVFLIFFLLFKLDII